MTHLLSNDLGLEITCLLLLHSCLMMLHLWLISMYSIIHTHFKRLMHTPFPVSIVSGFESKIILQ